MIWGAELRIRLRLWPTGIKSNVNVSIPFNYLGRARAEWHSDGDWEFEAATGLRPRPARPSRLGRENETPVEAPLVGTTEEDAPGSLSM